LPEPKAAGRASLRAPVWASLGAQGRREVREVREESGLGIEPVALTGVYKNMTRGIIALVFRCTITGGDLAATDESAAFRWVTCA
jgi:hypothetical protein